MKISLCTEIDQTRRTDTINLGKPPIIGKPKLKYWPADHDLRDIWTPYSIVESEPPVTAHTNCLVNVLLDLQVISWDISNYIFKDDAVQPNPDMEKMIGSFYDRLTEWCQGIPECVLASVGRSPTPGMMDLQ